MYLLDSDICINLLRGKLPNTLKLMKSSNPKLFGIPSIVEAELRTGALKSDHPRKNLLLLEQFLSAFEKITFDSACSVAYSKIRSYLEKNGSRIGPNDTLIAAMAIANNAVLVSGNIREFSRITNLSLENWDEIEL